MSDQPGAAIVKTIARRGHRSVAHGVDALTSLVATFYTRTVSNSLADGEIFGFRALDRHESNGNLDQNQLSIVGLVAT